MNYDKSLQIEPNYIGLGISENGQNMILDFGNSYLEGDIKKKEIKAQVYLDLKSYKAILQLLIKSTLIIEKLSGKNVLEDALKNIFDSIEDEMKDGDFDECTK